MSELNSKPSHNTDELLAAFTDQTLDDDNLLVESTIPEDDSELKALADTVLRIKDAFGDETIGDAQANRIYKNVMAELKRAPSEQAVHIPWLSRLKQTFAPQQPWRSRRSQQRFGLTLAFALTAILLFALTPFISGVVSATPGSAGLQSASLITVVFGIILTAVVICWVRRKK